MHAAWRYRTEFDMLSSAVVVGELVSIASARDHCPACGDAMDCCAHRYQDAVPVQYSDPWVHSHPSSGPACIHLSRTVSPGVHLERTYKPAGFSQVAR